jgi:hypothetical protein
VPAPAALSALGEEGRVVLRVARRDHDRRAERRQPAQAFTIAR